MSNPTRELESKWEQQTYMDQLRHGTPEHVEQDSCLHCGTYYVLKRKSDCFCRPKCEADQEQWQKDQVYWDQVEANDRERRACYR